MKIAVTGASGYIGQQVLRGADKRGISTLCLTRRAPGGGRPWQKFDLDDAGEVSLPADIDAVMHLAANTEDRDASKGLAEIDAAKRLLAGAREVGARFVFVSSQAAQPDALSSYGRTKWAIERLVLQEGGTVVRPGLVFGGPRRALQGRLVDLVARHPVIPALVPSPQVQPIHIDELVDALFKVVTQNLKGRVFHLGADPPMSFTVFLRYISEVRLCRRRLFVPVPAILVRLVTLLPLKQADSLRSLLTLKPMPTAADLRELGVDLRPVVEGMRVSANRRRELLEEGGALLSYISRTAVPWAMARRYVRAVERLRGGVPLGLPRVVSAFPSLVRAYEQADARRTELNWRLNAATRLAESLAENSSRFIRGRSTGLTFVRVLACAVLLEGAWRLIGLVLRLRLRDGK